MLGGLHLFLEPAALAALLGHDGIGLNLTEQGCRVIVLIVDQMVEGKLVFLGQQPGAVSVEYAPPTFVSLPEGTQLANGVDASQGQQSLHTLRLHLAHGIIVVLTPRHVVGMRRIDTVVADEGELQGVGHTDDRLVENLGEGMGGIDDQTDVVIAAETEHRLPVEGTVDAHTMMERHVLFARLRGVVVDVARLLQFLDGFAPFRRSS